MFQNPDMRACSSQFEDQVYSIIIIYIFVIIILFIIFRIFHDYAFFKCIFGVFLVHTNKLGMWTSELAFMLFLFQAVSIGSVCSKPSQSENPVTL